MNGKHKVAGLIVAGGSGSRLSSYNLPKQYLNIGGETILEKSIKALYNNDMIDVVCVVISQAHEKLFKNIAQKYDNLIYCFGGNLRQDSVRLGLEKLKLEAPALVLIHDAARPFVSETIINNIIAELQNEKVVLPAVKVKDTIKSVSNLVVDKTLNREKLYEAQTPQGFDYKTIVELHNRYKDIEFTDDAMLAEKAGIKVKIIAGNYANYKITTEEDLRIARMNNIKQTRIGNGFDVHQFESGDGVILCGVKIPYDKKLKGHSDADCAWHALTDAILGAIGLGDIGEHFPDNDMQWKGADSGIFLKKAVEEVQKLNGEIINVDITIICEEPKMKIHKLNMKESTAKILNISHDRINIKATTTEKLGFLGRKEGLAVFATAAIAV